MGKMYPELFSSSVIKRYENNPILTYKDVPYDSALTFNAGITKYEGKYVMVFRNDYGATEETWTDKTRFYAGGINLGIAFSDDGIKWTVREKPFFTQEQALAMEDVQRIYDPRLTVIDGELIMCCAMDLYHGVVGAIAKIHDLERIEFISTTVPDNRNMVLFPEKIGGLYTRLERPFPVYSRGRDQFDVWMSQSPDLKFWGNSKLVLGVEHVPYANDKLGPAAPPIKTEKGWLTTFHAVDIDDTREKNGWEAKWHKRYTAGIMLLDLNEPWKVVGMSKEPLIAPEADYEVDKGFRQNVIFPGGMILEDDGEVKIYYGSSDAFECLATANVDDLIKLCTESK